MVCFFLGTVENIRYTLALLFHRHSSYLFVTMHHIAPQKIVDWRQNSGGENVPLLFTRSSGVA
jgi:hypothetical protein